MIYVPEHTTLDTYRLTADLGIRIPNFDVIIEEIIDHYENHCHVCKSNLVEKFPIYNNFSLSTSDCKPINLTFQVVLCDDCNTVQKMINLEWKKLSKNIFILHDLLSK